MTKKLVFVIVLGTLLIGCKAKRSVSKNKKDRHSKTVVVKKSNSKKYKNDGRYPLPEDSGKFVRFKISSVEEYIATFSEIAQMEMKAYGIPASITLAQGLLESGFGKGALALKTNNHFGIKCHKGWDGDYDFHDDDEKGECFRKYNHPMYSFRDHSEFLSNRSRYAFLFNLRSDNYKAWAKGLRKAGYATDKRYPQKLISLIEQHRLFKYDRGISKKDRRKNSKNAIVGTVGPDTTVYTVKKGDTLYSISRRYMVTVAELKKLNRMKGNTLSIGQELTIK